MSKTASQAKAVQNNIANMNNANRGTTGTNLAHDQNQGNRGKQLNPTYRSK